MDSAAREQLLGHLQTELEQIFAAFVGGDDVAPSRRLRLEGAMQAGVLTGLLQEAELLSLLDAQYSAAFGEALDTASIAVRGHPRDKPYELIDIRIPVRMQRAPVYPS